MNTPTGANITRTTTTVIVVNFNGLRHLRTCLAGLEAQSLPPDEIIVVDNGSTDGTSEYLRSDCIEVKLIALPENVGFAAANLAGYEMASGDNVVLLNNDTLPQSDWLERLVICADHLPPDVGIVASHLTDWDGEITDSAGDGCSVSGRGFKWYHGRPTRIPLDCRYVFGACAAAVLYRREMLEDVGFLESDFFMNAEDTDLAFRAQLRGWRAYFCADAVVRHRIGASQGIQSRSHVRHSSRNHFRLYVRCLPGRLILRHAHAYLLHTLLHLAYFAPRGLATAYLAGLTEGLKELPELVAQRSRIQKRRKVAVRDIALVLTPLAVVVRQKLAENSEGS